MTNSDPRLCAECGARRELNTCGQMAARHCSACHLLLHGVDTPRAPAAATGLDSGAVAAVEVDLCRDCPKEAEWYAADGTGYCMGHGERMPAKARTGLEVGW